MSRAATDWAWKVKSKSASHKLILLALADRADEYHCCYPSISRLERDTQLNRKTIGEGINQMIDDGLISDTGERKGPTKRVRVLRLNVEKEQSQKRNDTKNGNITKYGSIDRGNDPKNGTLNDPKNGTLNDPKNGIQNQSLEPVKESKDKHPACAVSKYAFEGNVIRLNNKDFCAWKNLFPKIDLVSELQRYDMEFTHERPKNWFSTLSAKLKYQNDRATERSSSTIPTIQVSQSGYVFIN